MKRNAPVGRGWVIRGCLAGALVLSNVGCGPRLVRPPLPLADSDAAHQDRATITAISVESVSLIGPAMCPNAFYLMPQDRQCSCLQCTGKTGAWNVRLNLEISATTPQLVEEIAHECWYYLFEEGFASSGSHDRMDVISGSVVRQSSRRVCTFPIAI